MIVERTNTLMLCIRCTFGTFGLFRPFVKSIVQLDLMYLTEERIFGNIWESKSYLFLFSRLSAYGSKFVRCLPVV